MLARIDAPHRPLAQTLPQPLQFCGSLAGSTHAPLHRSCPVAHVGGGGDDASTAGGDESTATDESIAEDESTAAEESTPTELSPDAPGEAPGPPPESVARRATSCGSLPASSPE
jgi:hypothetical protein